MDTIFMNSGNRKTSDPHILLLNLSGKMNLKRNEKIHCFIKSEHLVYMENYKKVIQK